MKRSLQFQSLMLKKTALGTLVFLAAVIVAGRLFPDFTLVRTYYTAWPIVIIAIPLLTAVSANSCQLQIALSMGERRKSYFLAMQVSAVFFAIFGIATLAVLNCFPLIGAHPMNIGNLNIAIFVVAGYFIGTFGGDMMKKFRWGGLIIVGVCAVFVGIVTSLMTLKYWGQQGGIPAAVPLVGTLLIVVFEYLTWRSVRRATVR